MISIVVCIKQVPATDTVIPAGEGAIPMMMNPCCRSALEASLRFAGINDCSITAVTMGPPDAEEVLYEAGALGAGRCLLISDPALSGSDTSVTAHVLASALKIYCPSVDLVLCGLESSDSETAQVGPQLAEELGIPSLTGVGEFDLCSGFIKAGRRCDGFFEQFEVDMPCLLTISPESYVPAYIRPGNVISVFENAGILRIDADDLGLEREKLGAGGSPTAILDVWTPERSRENIVLKGAPGLVVQELLGLYEDRIGGACGRDLKGD